MRSHFVAASIIALGASITYTWAQQSAQTAGLPSQSPVTAIYNVGSGVAAPVLLPPGLIEVSREKCKSKYLSRDVVILSLFVSPEGKARRITFLQSAGNVLDQKALDIASADQFRPGSRNGEPVAVWQSLTIYMQSCVANPKDPNPAYRLIGQPEQLTSDMSDHPQAPPGFIDHDPDHPVVPLRVGGGVSPPVALFMPVAIYSEQARRKKVTGICLVSLIVDAHGMPQNAHLVRSLGYGLDENALAAAQRYRFKPALKGGFEPVPVTIAIEVNFRLY
jgi:TonB family protein